MVRSRSSFEAAADEWRFQDEVFHTYSSEVSRSCNLTASQNHIVTIPHAAHGPCDLLCSRSGFEATAEEWRFQDESCHACSSNV